MEFHQKKITLSFENLILRGCKLKNTEWILGIVIYTGHETKIMKNSQNARFKMSSIERGTNRQIIYLVLVQLVLCAFACTYNVVWLGNSRENNIFYIGLSSSDTTLANVL